MPELRWILVGFAIVLLAGIYLWGRRTSAPASDHDSTLRARPEPTLRDASEDELTQEMSSVVAEPSMRAAAPTIERHEHDPVPVSPSARDLGTPTVERSAAVTTGAHDTWRGRVEPTLGEPDQTAEMRAENPPEEDERSEEDRDVASADAPTLSSGDTPPPRRIERRKILALRLAATPHRLEGAKLLEAFAAESLQFGKYSIYHRLHDDGTSIFSVASMVEPGTFDLEKMPTTQYPGVTLFAQLPGPVPGMHALNELVACARRLQQSLGGTLQDDRGVPLTVHRIERLRQEVREFERPQNSANAARGVSPSKRQV